MPTATLNFGIARHKVFSTLAGLCLLAGIILMWSAIATIPPPTPAPEKVAQLWLPPGAEVMPVTGYSASGEVVYVALDTFQEHARGKQVSVFYDDKWRYGPIPVKQTSLIWPEAKNLYVLHEGDRTYVATQRVPFEPIPGWESEIRFDNMQFIRIATTWYSTSQLLFYILGIISLLIGFGLALAVFLGRNTDWDSSDISL